MLSSAGTWVFCERRWLNPSDECDLEALEQVNINRYSGSEKNMNFLRLYSKRIHDKETEVYSNLGRGVERQFIYGDWGKDPGIVSMSKPKI